MDSPIVQFIVILVVSMVAGCVNTMVGGGSYLTLPLLVLLGTGPVVANATNRFAIVFQAVAATTSFRSKGAVHWAEVIPLGIAALVGGVPGAMIADRMDPEQYRVAMGVFLASSVFVMFIRKKDAGEREMRLGLGVAGAFVLGMYGGFLGAGVGVLILTLLTPLMGITLIRMVPVKVFMVMAMSLSAAAVFVIDGMVDWSLVPPLVLGNILGGLIGARCTLAGGERWLRPMVAVIAVALALAMVFDVSPIRW